MHTSSGQINETSTEETRESREDVNHERSLAGPMKIGGSCERLHAECT